MRNYSRFTLHSLVVAALQTKVPCVLQPGYACFESYYYSGFTMKNIDRVELINNARAASFTQPIHEKFTFHRLPVQEFWDVYENDFHKHSPLDLFFEENKLRSTSESERLNLLNAPIADHGIEDNYLLLDANKNVIAMIRGWQKTFDSYYMQFTAVHTDYRKQGIYSEIINRVLAYTKLLGFSRVLSCHAPFNNAVLIAKLKMDFKMIAMDLDAALGVNVWLCYFHNEELKRAYEFRCGKMAFSKNLYSASLGTAEQLCKLVSQAK